MEELEALFLLVRDASLVILVSKDGTKIALDAGLQSLLTQGLFLIKSKNKEGAT